jgi:DNA-binding NarL/FixJ family response regulator
MKRKIKIAIVDDSNSYREFTILSLKRHKALDIDFACSNGKELINWPLLNTLDAVLLDVTMPIMDGIATTEYLSLHHPDIKILILTVHDNKNLARELLDKGANVYLLKDNGIEQVADAIYALFNYENYFNGWPSKKIPTENHNAIDISYSNVIISKNLLIKQTSLKKDLLTEQEINLLRHICMGLNSKQIGDKMCVSHRTIEKRRIKLQYKTNTNNLAELISYAYKNNIV